MSSLVREFFFQTRPIVFCRKPGLFPNSSPCILQIPELLNPDRQQSTEIQRFTSDRGAVRAEKKVMLDGGDAEKQGAVERRRVVGVDIFIAVTPGLGSRRRTPTTASWSRSLCRASATMHAPRRGRCCSATKSGPQLGRRSSLLLMRRSSSSPLPHRAPHGLGDEDMRCRSTAPI